jgi:hypothetical protein
MSTISEFPKDILDLICRDLSIRELHSISQTNQRLDHYINDEFVPENLLTNSKISSSQTIWAALRQDVSKKTLRGSHPNSILASNASYRIETQMASLPKISRDTDNTELNIMNASVAERTLNDLRISIDGKTPIRMQPIAQVRYIEDRNYTSFWKALKKSAKETKLDLPDLEGSEIIKGWLKDPKNHAVLGRITHLTINDPEFLFFPPEAKDVLTALRYFDCSDCTSLQSLNFQGCLALEHVNCLNCTSLQSLNCQGCLALTVVNCSSCTSLQSLDFEGCLALRDVCCGNCTSLQSLNLRNCLALKYLYCNACSSLQSVDLKNCLALKRAIFDHCIALKSLNLQDLQALESVHCNFCRSLQSVDLKNCLALIEASFDTCVALKSLNLQDLQALESVNCNYCGSLQNLNLQNCLSLQTVYGRFCMSLQNLNLRNCRMVRSIDCTYCHLLSIIDIRECRPAHPTIDRFESTALLDWKN